MMLSSVLFPSIRLKWRSLGVSACYFFTVQWIFTPNPWSTSMLFAGLVCSFRSAFLCRILYFYFSSFLILFVWWYLYAYWGLNITSFFLFSLFLQSVSLCFWKCIYMHMQKSILIIFSVIIEEKAYGQIN